MFTPDRSRIRLRCYKYGHSWKQKVWGMAGTDVCRRHGCDATRTNPLMVPPEWWGSE